MCVLQQRGFMAGGNFCSLKLIYLKHKIYSRGCHMEWFRGWWPQVNKNKFRENYKNIDHAFGPDGQVRGV